MEMTLLGSTGVSVSRLCLGCMSYGDPNWRPWVLDEAAAQPFFRRAVEAGINFFDTADMYSLGVSEEITGRALKQYARLDECVLATKVFQRMGEGPNRQGLSRKHIQQGCEASLKRLGVEAIDLYQVHRFDAKTPIDETLAALDLLVQQGKVRYIGASSTAAWRFMKSLGRSDQHGWVRFVSMQNHYNLLYREEEREMIPLCREENLAVLPWSPLARGLLTRPYRPEAAAATRRHESDDFTKKLYTAPCDRTIAEAVEQIATRRGIPMAQVALAWMLAKPGITAPIIGATKLSHLDDALAALQVKLSQDELRQLEAPYQPKEVLGHNH